MELKLLIDFLRLTDHSKLINCFIASVLNIKTTIFNHNSMFHLNYLIIENN